MNKMRVIPEPDFDLLVRGLETIAELALTNFPAPRAQRLFELVCRISKTLKFRADPINVERDGFPATTANDCGILVRFECSDRERSFLIALGARNIDVAVKHASLL